MISIIVPIYNTSQYLYDCLFSIQHQSYKDFEALCVDDGSTDNSSNIVEQFINSDSRFRLYQQSNAGVSAARNLGLVHARGEYVCFIDSDDTIDTDFLKVMLSNLDRFDAVNCDYTSDSKDLGKQSGVYTIFKEKYIKKIIYEKCKTPQLCTFVYRKEIIDKTELRFTPGCVRNEDYEFFMKYLTQCNNPIAIHKYIGYHYRQNPTSVMHQKRTRNSVLMSIEASTRVGEAVEKIGVIRDKKWLTSFSATALLYIMAREDNREVYDELHTLFPIHELTKISILYGGVRFKIAALLYFFLRKRLFYSVVSFLTHHF